MDVAKALLQGAAGGAVIAASSSLLMLLLGRITGVSGIVHTLVTGRPGGGLDTWRASWTAGLVTSGLIWAAVDPSVFGDRTGAPLKATVAATAGLLVGFGARMGGGCTSGHGVCGLPRFSMRSLTAVGTFMATGAITAHVVNRPEIAPMLHDMSGLAAPSFSVWPTIGAFLMLGALFHRHIIHHALVRVAPYFGVHASAPVHKHASYEHTTVAHHITSFVSAVLFGYGLGLSGMTNPGKVTGFLDAFGQRGWDVTLMGVMGAAVVVNVGTFYAMWKSRATPVLPEEHRALDPHAQAHPHPRKTFQDIIVIGGAPGNMRIDWRLVIGSALFGIGWGLAGMCPGPAIVSLGGGVPVAATFIPAMLAGMAGYEVTFGEGL